MTLYVHTDFSIPYEIAQYIESLLPPEEPEPQEYFPMKPDCTRDQMLQGLVLQVMKHSLVPQAIHMKYGRWMLFTKSNGDFREIFNIFRQTLNLQLVKYHHDDFSFWKIQRWNGEELRHPMRAKTRDYFDSYTLDLVYSQFLNDLGCEKPHLLFAEEEFLNSESDSDCAEVASQPEEPLPAAAEEEAVESQPEELLPAAAEEEAPNPPFFNQVIQKNTLYSGRSHEPWDPFFYQWPYQQAL